MGPRAGVRGLIQPSYYPVLDAVFIMRPPDPHVGSLRRTLSRGAYNRR